MSRPSVAVVVPLSSRPVLSADEQISLRHLEHYLGAFDKFFIAAEGTIFSRYGFETVTFPKRYFGSARAHAKLQLSREFYARFASYEYILMYHLDALVFSDQLFEWCETAYDYIGAPWLPCSDSPWVTTPRVGNGGFALIKISSFLRVIDSDARSVVPEDYWREVCGHSHGLRRWVKWPGKYLKRVRAFNGAAWEMRWWPYRRDGTGNSDYFWSDRAVTYWPQFKVAPVHTGLRFAFEVAPRMCFERTGGRLPFGCHAWPRYDRGFWEPYLLR